MLSSKPCSFSFCGLSRGVSFTAVACLLVVWMSLVQTHALPVNDVFARAVKAAKMEQQQQLQQLQLLQQDEGEELQREKRSVSRSICRQPSDLAQMFRQINSQLSVTKFLGKAVDGNAITVPEGSGFQPPDALPNLVCPTALNYSRSAPLSARQLCPFTYTVWRLPTGYYPPSLKWAVCNCTRCVENRAYKCQVLTSSVAVLRPAGCFNGLQKYEEHVLERVPTACACAL